LGSTTTQSKTFCCPEGWVEYRESCFHQSIETIINPNTLSNEQILKLCNEQIGARLAILNNSDSGNDI
jgi:hypothetical protein